MFSRSASERRSRLGVADHHGNVVAPALHALGLFAVERLAHLVAEVARGQPERLGGRQDLELEFLLAAPEGVADVEHAGKLRQLDLGTRSRRRAQLVEPGPLSSIITGEPAVRIEELKVSSSAPGNGPGLLAPAVG